MDIDLLKRLLAVQSFSLHEDRMVEAVMQHVQVNPRLRGRVETDHYKNVFITKGEAEFFPCLASHTDTVFPIREDVTILHRNGRISGKDAAGVPCGIGGDCKTGIFICLQLLELFDNIKVALFSGEEIGCQGAFGARKEFFDDVGYTIEFDCPSFGLMTHTCSGERLFENNGPFIKRAMPVLSEHGVTRWQSHPFTDVMALRQRFKFSCLNIGSGYHNMHRFNEYVDVEDVRKALHTGHGLVRALGENNYPVNDLTGDSPVPVTCFKL